MFAYCLRVSFVFSLLKQMVDFKKLAVNNVEKVQEAAVPKSTERNSDRLL